MQLTCPTTRDLRRANRLKVLQQIYARAPVSRLELSKICDVSFATVANIVTDLLNTGLVVEAGLADSRGGRPRAMLAINPDHGMLVGIDAAETYIHFDLFDLELRALGSVERQLHPAENQPEQIVNHILIGLDSLLVDAGVPREQVLGIGISVPGLVDQAHGVSIFAPNWGWRDVPLLALLRRQIELPLYLDNPLKASALAELWFGAGRGVDNIVTLTIGTGVGAGIVVNGALYRGAANSAGEWGHITVERNGRACRCGKQGCLETYIGAPGVIENLRTVAPHSSILQETDQTAMIAAIADAVRHDESDALQALDDTAEYLAMGIGTLLNLFNPHVVVLGGWVGTQLGPALLPRLQAALPRYALPQPREIAALTLGQLPHNPVTLGAATFALEGLLATLGKGGERVQDDKMTR